MATSKSHGIENGYRSGLEDTLAQQIENAGVPVNYESFRISFSQPQKARHYTPDYWLPNGIVIESKGRFLTADRQKHKLVQEQHPDLDIRFVFSRSSSRISKTSKTTYGGWCSSYGFKYADKLIPHAWFTEPVNHKSLNAIMEMMK